MSSHRTLDLNSSPPTETHEETYLQAISDNSEVRVYNFFRQEPMNDVEVIDEDISIISSRVYAEARRNPQENLAHHIMPTNGLAVGFQEAGHVPTDRFEYITWKNKRSRYVDDPNHLCKDLNQENPLITQELFEGVPSSVVATCPICLGHMTESTSTKCGHIFCKECITTAYDAQGKCPTCRQKIKKGDLLRVYLPPIK